jgi:hypothetical protein
MKAIKLFVTSILLLSSFQALAVMRNVIIIIAAVISYVSLISKFALFLSRAIIQGSSVVVSKENFFF